MKQAILLFFAGLCIINASAQKIRMTDTSNRWTLSYYNGGTGEMTYDTYEYKMGDDTTIGSQAYKKIVILSDKVTHDLHGLNPGGGGKEYIGSFFREDTVANQVYCITAGDTAEQLIYDASWRVGNSIAWRAKSFTGVNYNGYNKVFRRDSVFFNNAWYHLFLIGAEAVNFWVIEGVGSTRGTAFPAFPEVGELGSSLTCFKHDGGVPDFKFPSGGVAAYDNIKSYSKLLTISNTQSAPSSISITPNPGNREMYLNIPADMGQVMVRITDVTGRTVLTTELQSRQHISIGQYPSTPGLYYYQVIEASGNSHAGSIVFQD